MHSFYIYISSEDSSDYFTNNAYDFTVYLPETIKLSDKQWFVGIAEIQYSLTPQHNENMIEIYSDICAGSIIHEKRRPILRNITLLNNRRNVTLHKNFNPIIYIPIIKHEIRQIRMYINLPNSQSASFMRGFTRCTLHFKASLK
jgi:hypothetical protein